MNKLKEEFANTELVKRIQSLEYIIDNNNVLNEKLASLKALQKKMINAKEFNQVNQYKAYKKEYDSLYEEILEFPFVEEYLDLLEQANNTLLDICYIIENKINNEVYDEVLEMFSQVLHKEKDKISGNDHFIFDLGGTSLEYITLLINLKSKYEMDFNFGEGESCYTVYEIVNYILKKRD